MFDWDDEELENIIWGDEGESEDHIVPYPKGSEGRPTAEYGDQNKKEWKQESSALKSGHTSADKTDLRGCQLRITSKFGSNDEHSSSGFCMASRPDLSSSNVADTDQDMGVEAPFEKHTEIYQSRHENKEHGDYVDYDWANIGSFDDLDIIFSNDDPIFGRTSLDNADELWSSSKEAGDSPVKLLPLSAEYSSLGVGASNTASENNEVKSEYGQNVEQPFNPGYSKWSDSTSHNLQHMHGNMDEAKLGMVQKTTALNSYTVTDNATALNNLADKVSKRKKVQKYQKVGEKGASGLLHDSYGNLVLPGRQSLQLKTQVSPPVFLSRQGPESFQYQHISSPHLASSTYGNPTKQCTSAPLTMTPQEKIEKLRRRQQMQAMLAIQKQHQQLNNLVPSANLTINNNQIPFTEGDNVEVRENLSSFSSLDPDSTIEQDSSNTVSMVTDNYSPEEAIFYKLQDAISKLDIKARLCIRDSMFRLAQCYLQRHCESETSSVNENNRDEHNVTPKQESESYNRLAKIPDVETDTNPVDRTVAQLLFNRPLEISPKQPRTPVPIGNFSRNSKTIRRSKNHCPLEDSRNGELYINSPCIDKNAANNDLLDGGAMQVENSC